MKLFWSEVMRLLLTQKMLIGWMLHPISIFDYEVFDLLKF